jgi:hypothetical protein
VHVHANDAYQWGQSVISVGGHKNKPEAPPIERIHKAYRVACAKFADDLGWDKNTIAHWFEQFHLMRQKEQSWPSGLAAWMAMRDVREFFYNAKFGEGGNN